MRGAIESAAPAWWCMLKGLNNNLHFPPYICLILSLYLAPRKRRAAHVFPKNGLRNCIRFFAAQRSDFCTISVAKRHPKSTQNWPRMDHKFHFCLDLKLDAFFYGFLMELDPMLGVFFSIKLKKVEYLIKHGLS